MPVVLPIVPSVPNYRVSTTLDDVSYVLDVRWNGRAEAWYMDVRTDEGEAIRVGLKLVLGAYHGMRVTDERFPNGIFTAVDLSGEHREATLDDMGTRVVVLYYPASEIAAL